MMDDIQLGQTLLVRPDVPFEKISATLNKLGWQQQQAAQTPLLENEPEFSSWSWQGHKPFVIYTFNPVVNMRVLDVATLPPVMRGAIASHLPLLDDEMVASLFSSGSARERLLALWAVKETERLDLIDDSARLQQDPESAVAEQAGEVHARLEQINQARVEMLTNLRIMTEAAPQLIRLLPNSETVAQLKPTGDDLAALFDEDLLPVVSKAVEAIYKKRLRVSIEHNTEIDVFASPAGLFRWQNMLSEKFPGGYRDIAGWMNPQHIWMGWTLTTPEGGVVRYDGLVWVNGNWRWLPKIFRYLTPYLMDQPRAYAGSH